MARKANDGRGRLGGRKKGTPNKISGDLRGWVSELINNHREQFERDLESLDSVERIKALSGLFNYIIPKKQSLSIEEQIQTETESLTRFLETAPEEAIDKIAERIIQIQSLNRKEEEDGE